MGTTEVSSSDPVIAVNADMPIEYSEINVSFHLHTAIGATKLTSKSLEHFDGRKYTKFIIHGWLESSDTALFRAMANAYLSKKNYTIIIVDWSGDARTTYTLAALKTPLVGRIVGDFIVQLLQNNGLVLNRLHVIGFSFGGQTAGFAGKRVHQLVGSKIGRITGLDPAGPHFENDLTVTNLRPLSRNDAEFVDVIHTATGSVGFAKPCGSIDFYPNGDGVQIQPGCLDATSIADLLKIGFACSHIRAVEYFIESINSKGFEAVECKSWSSYNTGECSSNVKNIMGENVDFEKRGIYYLKTNGKRPFAMSN